MALEIFPTTLPNFLAGPSYYTPDALVYTAMGAGLPTGGQKVKEPPVYFNLALLLTSAQLTTFTTWRRDTLKYIKWFTADIRTASGLEARQLKFTSSDEVKEYIGGDSWKLTFMLEAPKHSYVPAVPDPPANVDYVESTFGIPYDDVPAFLNILEETANENLAGVMP